MGHPEVLKPENASPRDFSLNRNPAWNMIRCGPSQRSDHGVWEITGPIN